MILVDLIILFAVLAGVISAVAFSANRFFALKKKANAPTDEFAATVATEPTGIVQSDAVDDLELVAIITAALSANLNTKTDTLVVRSIKRSQKWSGTTRH